MDVATRSLAVLLIACGVFTAGWGPIVFELLSGSELPQPVAEDATAMAIWSGVAFTRAFGAVLVCVGALLLGTVAVDRRHAMMKGLFWSALLATAITASQQQAIWSNRVGYVLVALLLALTLFAGSQWLTSRGRPRQRAV